MIMDFIFWALIIVSIIGSFLAVFMIFGLFLSVRNDKIEQEKINDIIEKLNKGKRQ